MATGLHEQQHPGTMSLRAGSMNSVFSSCNYSAFLLCYIFISLLNFKPIIEIILSKLILLSRQYYNTLVVLKLTIFYVKILSLFYKWWKEGFRFILFYFFKFKMTVFCI